MFFALIQETGKNGFASALPFRSEATETRGHLV
jgi:hypothetical protein